MVELLFPKIFFEICLSDCQCCSLIFNKLDGSRPAKSIDQFFQVTDTGLHCVFINNPANRSVGYFQCIFLNSHGIESLWKKMSAGNLIFFYCSVTGEINNLHTVEQWFRNRIQ